MSAGDMDSILSYSYGGKESISFDIEGHAHTSKEEMTKEQAQMSFEVLNRVLQMLEDGEKPAATFTAGKGAELELTIYNVYRNVVSDYKQLNSDDKVELFKTPSKMMQYNHMMDNIPMVEKMVLGQQNRSISSSLNIDFPRLCQSNTLELRVDGSKLEVDEDNADAKGVTFTYINEILTALGGTESDIDFLNAKYPTAEDQMGAMSTFLEGAKASESQHIKALLKVMSSSCQAIMFPVTGAAQDTFGGILDKEKLKPVAESRYVVITIGTGSNDAESSAASDSRDTSFVHVEQGLSLIGESKKRRFRKTPTPTIIHTTALLKKSLKVLDSPWESVKFGFLSLEGSDSKECNKRIDQVMGYHKTN
jgi:hypothetical protein